jgi:hypothetical protein
VVEHIRTVLERLHYKISKFQKIQKIPFLPILATFYEVKITFFKKLVDEAPATYLKFDVF